MIKLALFSYSSFTCDDTQLIEKIVNQRDMIAFVARDKSMEGKALVKLGVTPRHILTSHKNENKWQSNYRVIKSTLGAVILSGGNEEPITGNDFKIKAFAKSNCKAVCVAYLEHGTVTFVKI